MSIREEMEELRHPSDTGIHADLRWLAENVSDWKDDCYKFIGALGFMVDWQFNCPHNIHTYFSRDQWQAARDELISPFNSPEEDEAWQAAEKRMDIIGHNGGTGEHYEAESLEERYPQYYKSVRHLEFVDAYRVHTLFAIEDCSGCIQHASKKLLLSGSRTGGKEKRQDIEEARDTLTRWLELEQGR